MNNHERLNSPTSETSVSAPQETWQEHLARAKRLLSRFHKEKSSETVLSDNYLLSEHLTSSETPFGKPQSNSLKDRKFANKWYKDLCEGWDKCGIDIPRELGEQLEDVVKDPDYFFGVHRSYAIDGETCETDPVLHNILTEGLVNFGDASSGAIYSDPDVSKTVSPCTNMLNTVINLKTSYKGSNGAVLVRIPSKYVDKQTGSIRPGMANEIYNHNDLGNSFLKPEFIMGFVTRPNQGRCEFKTRQELLDNYQEDSIPPEYISPSEL